jgi:serine/threonine-protein kinase
MSLEQLRGDKDIDQRADVYAFGVMLYEAVTGSLPYEAETLPELAIKVATTDPAPVKSLRPDVPTPLAKIIDWAVARDRKQRLPDIRTLQQELEVFAREHSFREQMTHREAPVPLLAAEKSGPAEPTKAPRPEPAAKGGARVPPPLPAEPDTLRARELVTAAPPRRTGARWAAVGAAIVGALGIGGWLLRQAPAEPGALDERGATTLSPSATSTTSAATGAPPADARPREQAPPGPSPLPAPGVRAQELVPGKDDKETLATDKPTPASLNAAAPRQTPAAAPESVKHPALPGSPATAQKVELPRAKDIAAPPPAAKPALASQVPAKPLTNPSPLPAAINIKAPPATAQPAPAKKKSSLDLVGF